MDTRPAVPPRMGLGWLGPVAAGAALVAVAFFAASYLSRPDEAADPTARLIADLEDQVRADPQNTDLRVVVAEAYLEAGRAEDALAQYDEALRLDPEREDGLYGLGLTYRELGQPDQAAAAFQAIIEANKDNPNEALNRRLQGAHFYQGLILRDAGRYEDAINELRLALGLNRSDADTLFELGKTFALNGNTDDAIAAFDVTLAYVPDYREAYVELEKIATASGDQPRAAFARAMLLVLDGKEEEAIPVLKQAAEQAESARYWWGLGYAQERSGDEAGAIAAYRRAVELNPGELLAAESLRRLQAGGEP
ncbi:MAG: tetratricopeptide repeat protein [Chloroflexi bacterium]|nr:tetratricopeptide repeat protein [Chloroflexota bacterium]